MQRKSKTQHTVAAQSIHSGAVTPVSYVYRFIPRFWSKIIEADNLNSPVLFFSKSFDTAIFQIGKFGFYLICKLLIAANNYLLS